MMLAYASEGETIPHIRTYPDRIDPLPIIRAMYRQGVVYIERLDATDELETPECPAN